MRNLRLACSITAALATAPSLAQSPAAADPGTSALVHYEVSFPNAVHHEARVAATWRVVPAGPLRVQMSRSSPGRYAIHEFAKNVYDISARDGAGRPLRLIRNDPYGWSVEGHDGTVVVTYTLFGDHGDGTYAQIDATHAHLNMPATFLWASGYDARPIRVRFQPFDPKWRVATQLPAATASNTYWAPNLQYFMDSPTELSDHMVREWREAGRTYRLAVHHTGTAADLDRFTEKVKRTVRQHIAVFREPPAYDFGTYTFIADYMPQITGDGMEHRNSTIITDKRSLHRADDAQLNTLSHEFVHSWNVERIRPRGLEPFDFTRANPTPSLWVAEGFTQYYGPLMIRRAGVSSIDAFLADLGATVNSIVNSPARAAARINASPQEMSLRAPFVDAARAIDPVNSNMFVSYYPYGAVLALALDLELRQRFPGVSLDDYMRLLWQTYGATETPYSPDDLRQTLGKLTGDQVFADRFFRASVEGSALPDFAPLLAQAGLTLRRAHPERAWLGADRVTVEGSIVSLGQAPAEGTPLYLAGVDAGDQLVTLGRTPLANATDLPSAMARLTPGEQVQVRYRQRGLDRTALMRAASDP
ncbi:MAG TPA: M61 family peptidase, partial [Sphingomonas sp.]|nr:M61 family peptidase [Sphingomonas sp.]